MGSTGCGSSPHDDLAGDGIVVRQPLRTVGCLGLGRNKLYDAAAVTVVDETYLEPPVWSAVDLRTGEHDRGAPRRGARASTRTAYVVERRTFPAPDGTPVPAVLLRHRDTPLDGTAPCLIYAYGAYEAVDEPEWDPALPSLLDRGVVWVHAQSAAAARAAGAGGSTAACGTSSTPSTTSPRSPTASTGRARRRGPDRDPRPERRRAAPGRGLQPAPRPLAGGGRRGAVRRRGDHDVRRDRSR